METKSRIRFNPGTGEVEIEGTEKFVAGNLSMLLNFMSGSPQKEKPEPGVLKRAAKGSKVSQPAAKRGKRTKAGQAPAGQRKKTMFDTVVDHVLNSKGVTTSELKQKTGFTEHQIWSITRKASKLGKIKTEKRGIYIPA